MALTLKSNIKDWYEDAYPMDDLASEINSKVTFEDVLNCLNAGRDVYRCIGEGDSVIREHIFMQLAKILDVKYDVIYDKWLDGEDTPAIVKESAKRARKLAESSDVVNVSDIKNKVIKQAQRAFKEKDYTCTYLVPLGVIGKNRWAIAIAWMDYDNDDNWQVFAKVGFQPKNSIMQEYDMDWDMPYDEDTGEVWDTEVSLGTEYSNVSSDAAWLANQWKEIYAEITKEDDIDENVKRRQIMDYLLEGIDIATARMLAEDTITPETLYKVIQTPAYKKLLKDIEYYFKAVDDIREYRDTVFRKAPIDTLEGEADFCEDTADFLKSIQLKGFSPELTKDFMRSAKDDASYLNNSALRLKNILKKQDDSLYLRPDGRVNVNTNQKPGEYARRALRALQKFFAKLGLEFDYDIDYYDKNPEEFADLDKVIRRKGKVALPYESKSLRRKRF